MSRFLSPEEIAELQPSELLPNETPIPTQIVSSDEFYPTPQTGPQKQVEARLLAMADELGSHQGMNRRQFFRSAAGMAAAFVAMNEVYGLVFGASRAEAASPELANERAGTYRDQFIMDMHTHFLRDDTRLERFVRMREAVGRAGWNKPLGEREQTLEDLKYENYLKEIYLDSDTKIALISSSPSDEAQDWFLTNEQMAEAREKVNAHAGSKRLYTHAIFTPGQPGWLEQLDAALELKPDSVKGYTVGDNTHKATSRYPWRMDDEQVAYKGYEKMLKAGVKNVCVHKGLFPPLHGRALSASARLRRRARRGPGGQGLAGPELHHLPLRLPPRGRRSGGGPAGIRDHRAHRLGQRPGGHSREVRGEQCLR